MDRIEHQTSHEDDSFQQEHPAKAAYIVRQASPDRQAAPTDYLYTHLKEEDVKNRVCREQLAIYDGSLYCHLVLQYR